MRSGMAHVAWFWFYSNEYTGLELLAGVRLMMAGF